MYPLHELFVLFAVFSGSFEALTKVDVVMKEDETIPPAVPPVIFSYFALPSVQEICLQFDVVLWGDLFCKDP